MEKIERKILTENVMKIFSFIEENSVDTFREYISFKHEYKSRNIYNTDIRISGNSVCIHTEYGEYGMNTINIYSDGCVKIIDTRKNDETWSQDVTKEWNDNSNRSEFAYLEEAICGFCVHWKDIKKEILEMIEKHKKAVEIERILKFKV